MAQLLFANIKPKLICTKIQFLHTRIILTVQACTYLPVQPRNRRPLLLLTYLSAIQQQIRYHYMSSQYGVATTTFITTPTEHVGIFVAQHSLLSMQGIFYIPYKTDRIQSRLSTEDFHASFLEWSFYCFDHLWSIKRTR